MVDDGAVPAGMTAELTFADADHVLASAADLDLDLDLGRVAAIHQDARRLRA